jgi:hypothetical protein
VPRSVVARMRPVGLRPYAWRRAGRWAEVPNGRSFGPPLDAAVRSPALGGTPCLTSSYWLSPASCGSTCCSSGSACGWHVRCELTTVTLPAVSALDIAVPQTKCEPRYMHGRGANGAPGQCRGSRWHRRASLNASARRWLPNRPPGSSWAWRAARAKSIRASTALRSGAPGPEAPIESGRGSAPQDALLQLRYSSGSWTPSSSGPLARLLRRARRGAAPREHEGVGSRLIANRDRLEVTQCRSAN